MQPRLSENKYADNAGTRGSLEPSGSGIRASTASYGRKSTGHEEDTKVLASFDDEKSAPPAERRSLASRLCSCFVKDDEDARMIKQEEQSNVYNDVVVFLKAVPLFKPLDLGHLPLLAKKMRLEEHAPGTVLFTQGDAEADPRFYLVYAGKAHLESVGEGGAVLNRTLERGDYFGEGSVVWDEKRVSTVTALESDCLLRTISIGKSDFRLEDLHTKLKFVKRRAIKQAVKKEDHDAHDLEVVEKSVGDTTLIQYAITSNPNLQPILDFTQAMLDHATVFSVPTTVKGGTTILTKGSRTVRDFYVVKEGRLALFDVKGEREERIREFGPGSSYGGLAIILDTEQKYTLRAETDATCFMLSRKAFRHALLRASADEVEHFVEIINNVPLLAPLMTETKRQLAEAMHPIAFNAQEVIMKEGDMGEMFYIITRGTVEVTAAGKAMGTLGPGEVFGEQALLSGEPRKATARATDPVEVISIDREGFQLLLGPLQDLLNDAARDLTNQDRFDQSKNWTRKVLNAGAQDDKTEIYKRIGSSAAAGAKKDKTGATGFWQKTNLLSFGELKKIAVLGRGGYGYVHLVESSKKSLHALKACSKAHVLREDMAKNIMREKEVLSMTESPFIMQMQQTFQDGSFVYFLLELATGGDLAGAMERVRDQDKSAKLPVVAPFYCACVVLALEHLHARRICYRDLKPENVILGDNGYGKLCDMGMAKFTFGRTFTFVGTPDYMAPEVIAQTGHSCPVDWFALGVMAYTLVKGKTPSDAHEHNHYLQAFNLAKKGYDGWSKPPSDRMRPMDPPELLPPMSKGFWSDTLAVAQQLCVVNPAARLPVKHGGLGQLKKMAFFAPVDWQKLEEHTLDAPLKPQAFDPEALRKKTRHMNEEYEAYLLEESHEVVYPDGIDPFEGF